MSLKFNSIGQIEKDYFFIDAVTDEVVLNGAFGDIVDGKFAVGANASKAIMQIEVGDDMYMDEYKINAGAHVRVVDLARVVAHSHNKLIEIYGAQLPATFAVGDKLVSDAEGKLVVGDGAPCYEIKEIIGNKLGVKAEIVTE